MALHTSIRVSIGDTQLTVIDDFSLTENVGSHATFQIAIEGEHFANGQNTSTSLLEGSSTYLGETCSVIIEDLSQNSDSAPFHFKGVVTHLEGYRDSNDGEIREMVLISGMSSSIILDGGSNITSYSEQQLSAIITDVIQGADQSLLNTVVAPETDTMLAYSVQQSLSQFEYLKHLAATNGEYLLYVNDTLYFGKPDLGASVELHLGSSLDNISIGINTRASKANYFTHDYFNQTHVSSSTEDTQVASSGLIGISSNANDRLYANVPLVPFSTYEDMELQQRLDAAVAKQKKVDAQALVTLNGTSYSTSVSLGSIINIRNAGNGYGEYRVISITHSCNDSGNYKNTFSAIPIDVDVYPLTNISTILRSDSQVAKVIDNVDPEGMSRIKVQFSWQAPLNLTTPWLRVLTPSSGADKGFHFIPEVEEEVLIGFEGGNVERPYVIGSLYTGVNKPESWQSDANNIKAIRTRSGHTIEFNDTEGEETIRIHDNEGSIITFNTQEKSLTINATENIDITAKNINLTATEKVSIGSEQDIEINATNQLKAMSSDKIALQSTGDTTIKGNGKLTLEGTSEATLKGTKAIVEGTATAEVNGATAKLNGETMTEVAGAVVKLN